MSIIWRKFTFGWEESGILAKNPVAWYNSDTKVLEDLKNVKIHAHAAAADSLLACYYYSEARILDMQRDTLPDRVDIRACGGSARAVRYYCNLLRICELWNVVYRCRAARQSPRNPDVGAEVGVPDRFDGR